MKQISGTHLLIDGYVKNAASLNPDNIITLFDRLVEALGMQYLQRPIAMRVQPDESKLASDEDEGGWSVIAQITTSHIALHSWPLRRAFMMDAFSCHRFDTDEALALTWAALDVESARWQTIERKGPPNPT